MALSRSKPSMLRERVRREHSVKRLIYLPCVEKKVSSADSLPNHDPGWLKGLDGATVWVRVRKGDLRAS